MGITQYAPMCTNCLPLSKENTSSAKSLITKLFSEFERNKRGFIQYQTEEIDKKSKAETSLKRAKEFLFEMNDLLNEINKKKS